MYHGSCARTRQIVPGLGGSKLRVTHLCRVYPLGGSGSQGPIVTFLGILANESRVRVSQNRCSDLGRDEGAMGGYADLLVMPVKPGHGVLEERAVVLDDVEGHLLRLESREGGNTIRGAFTRSHGLSH
jgi:hypothetical protein